MVIWIIITLIAILLPVFTKAKHTAQIRKWQAALEDSGPKHQEAVNNLVEIIHSEEFQTKKPYWIIKGSNREVLEKAGFKEYRTFEGPDGKMTMFVDRDEGLYFIRFKNNKADLVDKIWVLTTDSLYPNPNMF